MVRRLLRCRMARGAAGAIAICALGGIIQALGAGCESAHEYPELKARNGAVTVDLSSLGAGGGRFYAYRSTSGKLVNFLAYRDSSGAPHAVLDACRTCYRWRKGYRLEGDEVVCIKCDMRFKLESLRQGIGSCVPIPVASEPQGGTLVIPVEELEAGSRFF